MRTVAEMLRAKPDDVWTISPDATVYDALVALADHDVGALPVVDGDSLLGIFSERDYARNVALKGRASRDVPVRELMATSVVCVSPTDGIQDCMALMTERRVRHLPVLEGEHLVGIITIGDVVRQVIADQEHVIEELERFIRGGP